MRTPEQSAKVINYDEPTLLLEPVNYDTVPHYQEDHLPFYEMYRTLLDREFTPNNVHILISELNKKGILLVNLTTNIDGLAI
jgi:NAD-dependent SIR2 family protein deacetylase